MRLSQLEHFAYTSLRQKNDDMQEELIAQHKRNELQSIGEMSCTTWEDQVAQHRKNELHNTGGMNCTTQEE